MGPGLVWSNVLRMPQCLGESPPLVGRWGKGTIFLPRCTTGRVLCQNQGSSPEWRDRRVTGAGSATPGARKDLMRRRVARNHDEIPVEDDEDPLASGVDGESMRLGHPLFVHDPHSNPPVTHRGADAEPQ